MPTLPRPAVKRFDITIAGETNLDLILYGLPESMAVDRELLASGFTDASRWDSRVLLFHGA